jgi:hypothetical protein
MACFLSAKEWKVPSSFVPPKFTGPEELVFGVLSLDFEDAKRLPFTRESCRFYKCSLALVY